jgi:hypothetical protein
MSASNVNNKPVDTDKSEDMDKAGDIETQSPPGSSGLNPSRGKKGGVRTGDKDNEEIVIPKNRIIIVFIGLMLTTFLAALDQTIVCTALETRKCLLAATALPTIIEDLQGGQDYAWVGTSYLLASTAFTPIYGRGSDLLGRKPMLYGSILIFLFGSALCGAAQSTINLVLANQRHDMAHSCESSSRNRRRKYSRLDANRY